MSNSLTEKRRFVRVSDQIFMAIRTLEEAEVLLNQLKEQGQPEDGSGTPIGHQLKELDNQLSIMLHTLGDKMPNTSKTLALLNKKIDLIAHYILKGEIDDDHKEQEVSISAAGIGFSSDTAFSDGQVIALDIMLQPTPYRIINRARIVSSSKTGSELSSLSPNYFVRAEFENLNEENEEILIQHVIRRQSVILKQRRLTREAHIYNKDPNL